MKTRLRPLKPHLADPVILAPLSALLERGLNDDGAALDLTTRALGGARARSVRARVIAKSDGVWAGDELTLALARLASGAIRVTSAIGNGQRFQGVRRPVLVEWVGRADTVLALERPYLNLLSYVCGVATQTQALVVQVDRAWRTLPARLRQRSRAPQVTPTRKILPGYRELALLGVTAGGGAWHRVSLSGGVLIKENHLAAWQSPRESRASAIQGLSAAAVTSAPHLSRVEVEVRDLSELKAALKAGADAVMLDNFSPSEVERAVALIAASSSPRIWVEVSGGIRPESIAQYVLPGVHRISSGALTHSPASVDFSLLVESQR